MLFLPKQSSLAVDCCQQTLQGWFSVWLSSISWLLTLFLEPFADFKDGTGCIPVLAWEQLHAIRLLQSFILTNVLFQHRYFSSRSMKQCSLLTLELLLCGSMVSSPFILFIAEGDLAAEM